MRIREIILSEVSDKVKQQVAAKWKQENTALTDENINYYLNLWDRFAKTFPVDKRDITRLQFTEVESLIDAAVSRQKMKGKAKPQTEKNPADAIYNKNNLEIYKGDLREKCIIYGRGYSWCISRPDSGNLFYSYRMRANEPVFYFVFDLDRPRDDPWHAVVIYVDKDNTYTVANALNQGDREMTWDKIIRAHPKLNGLQNIFQPQPLSDQEREDHKKFSNPVDLDQYRAFNLDEKYKYFMFGHALSPEQQDVTPDELIGAYAKEQVFKISKNTWYSRLSAGDRRKIEKTQISSFPAIAEEEAGFLVKHIFDAGIIPSEEVMMAAVKYFDTAIEYILDAGIKPSEEMLMFAVKSHLSSAYSLKYILEPILKAGIKPSEEMLMTVAENGYIEPILDAGIKPSEEMLMAHIKSRKGSGGMIEPILDAGIKPSEELMMTAILQDSHPQPLENLRNILKAGIKPSEEVMMAAVKSDGVSLAPIVRIGGIKPSEEMIMAALAQEQNSWNIRQIIKSLLIAGIKPSDEAMMFALRKNKNILDHDNHNDIIKKEFLKRGLPLNPTEKDGK